MSEETDLVVERYARRASLDANLYSMLNPEVWQGVQERQRGIIDLINCSIDKPLANLKVLEIGCGSESNLLELIRLGFLPENLIGNELLPERAEMTRRNLPALCKVEEGDACLLNYPKESLDIVYQSTVFTSLLDDKFQEKLAKIIWKWVKPGGGYFGMILSIIILKIKMYVVSLLKELRNYFLMLLLPQNELHWLRLLVAK